MLELDNFKLNKSHNESKVTKVEKISTRDIAIIGMAGRFSGSDDLEDFWAKLREGRDLIRTFPARRRRDTDSYLKNIHEFEGRIEYIEGGYFEEIDKFDPLFFNISPRQANLMDPHQRLFLQNAWHTLEDAGYGGEKLKGSNTGIYLGYSSDFGNEYRELVQNSGADMINLSLGGNIKSIIASRIAYILDFKGPSMTVDTACSSSLTAIHLACQGLRAGDCDQALVGSVQVKLLPLKGQSEGVGIQSANGRSKTFDQSSDGIGVGEGYASILLKPLNRALEDKDRVLAVIKGSGINQDGSSIGITAPNALAQADVIERAWKDGEIDPETITYIEAHGTGTSLGDPIEIDGISRIFKKYSQKKQFCGIGAAKTNTGHLDNAAGMVGVVKSIMALQHREIPPTIHFEEPNHEINFLDSPVYVVDRLTPWVSEGQPRRCGISAFGLSGTNAHLVLEEAPELEEEANHLEGPYLLTISAIKEEILKELVGSYHQMTQTSKELDLAGICYTANTGRGHYSHRLVLEFEDESELREQLKAIKESNNLTDLSIEGVSYASIKVDDQKRQQLTTVADEKLTAPIEPAQCHAIIDLYLEGAEIDWERYYGDNQPVKVKLPTYPFEERRCWIELEDNSQLHPLVDGLYEETGDEKVYLTDFSPERQWELEDHLISGHYVLPGTAYLEMAREVTRDQYPAGIELRDVIFLTPMAMEEGEEREAQTILQNGDGYYEFNVVSKGQRGEEWVTHVDAKVAPFDEELGQYDIQELLSRCPETIHAKYSDNTERAIVVGPHWKNVDTYNIGDDELVVHLKLQDQFLDDLDNYTIYPSLLDTAVNAASQHIGEGLYLPFSYKSFKLINKMPANFYSHIQKRDKQDEGLETIAFDLTLMDEEGKAFIKIEDYKVKKVRTNQLKIDASQKYHQIHWIESPDLEEKIDSSDKYLIFNDEVGLANRLTDKLEDAGCQVINVDLGSEYQQVSSGYFVISPAEEDYLKLLEELKGSGITKIIHLAANNGGVDEIKELEELQNYLDRGVKSLFRLTRALVGAGWKEKLQLYIIANQAHQITGQEDNLYPANAALFGLAKVVGTELNNLSQTSIDIDSRTPVETIIGEINSPLDTVQVAYRRGRRYIEEFKPVELDSFNDHQVELKEEGVYLVTGGTGALGLAVSKYLVGEHPVNLALLNRTSLPQRSEWEQIIATEEGKLANKLSAIIELEEEGAEVSHYPVDLAQDQKLAQALEDMRAKYGRINGIIHCAGVAGDGFVFRKEETTFNQVIEPKIHGTWNLDRLTREDEPDFFILFSSINAHYGQPGQGDYTAANSYMDSFAAYRNQLGLDTLAINWAAWQEIGMAVDYGVNNQQGIFKPLPTKMALTSFDQLLQKDITQITVGELNYDFLTGLEGSYPFELSGQIKSKISRRKKINPRSQDKNSHKRSKKEFVLTGDDEFNDTEKIVAQIWADILELEEVDIYQSFYELGGDSILATYILKELEEEFPGMVDISDIFSYSSVHEMAEYLEDQMDDSGYETEEEEEDFDSAVDDMLDMLEKGEVNAEDAEKLLFDKLGGNM